MTFAKILACIDGSKYSLKAVTIACDMAKKHNSSLSIIYVVDKTTRSDVLAGSEYTKILRKYAKDALEKAYQTALLQGVQPSIIRKEGNVANEIIQYSKTSKTDLIVVGSKGLGAVLRFVLGSVSSKIAQHSLCSVLIVK
jgi:nucleotide-binding universal stress UspA family protein